MTQPGTQEALLTDEQIGVLLDTADGEHILGVDNYGYELDAGDLRELAEKSPAINLAHRALSGEVELGDNEANEGLIRGLLSESVTWEIEQDDVQEVTRAAKTVVSILTDKGSAFDEYTGFGENGVHRNGTKYDERGFDSEGYNADGFDIHGIDREGYDENGYNEDFDYEAWEDDQAAKRERDEEARRYPEDES